ncbi:hypothetical protein ScPMuIL_012587, partial [Solemya velum]
YNSVIGKLPPELKPRKTDGTTVRLSELGKKNTSTNSTKKLQPSTILIKSTSQHGFCISLCL